MNIVLPIYEKQLQTTNLIIYYENDEYKVITKITNELDINLVLSKAEFSKECLIDL